MHIFLLCKFDVIDNWIRRAIVPVAEVCRTSVPVLLGLCQMMGVAEMVVC